MTLTIKPFYQKLVPRLSSEEYDSLKESIKLHGLWLPIVINKKNVILDGHHRYKICLEFGIEVKTIIRNFSDDVDEAIFVGECNLKRRHLEPIQRIDLVRKLEPYYQKKAKENLSKVGKGLPILAKVNTRESLASKANVSHGTFDKGTKVLKSASKEEIEEINQGTKSINSVYEKITHEEGNHFRHNLKKPYSISLHEDLIRGIQYYKRTYPQQNLDKQIEDFIGTIVPVITA